MSKVAHPTPAKFAEIFSIRICHPKIWQIFGCLNPKFWLGLPHFFLNQNFDSADQKIGNATGLTKNEGQSNKNFGQPNQIAIWLSQLLQKVGIA